MSNLLTGDVELSPFNPLCDIHRSGHIQVVRCFNRLIRVVVAGRCIAMAVVVIVPVRALVRVGTVCIVALILSVLVVGVAVAVVAIMRTFVLVAVVLTRLLIRCILIVAVSVIRLLIAAILPAVLIVSVIWGSFIVVLLLLLCWGPVGVLDRRLCCSQSSSATAAVDALLQRLPPRTQPAGLPKRTRAAANT